MRLQSVPAKAKSYTIRRFTKVKSFLQVDSIELKWNKSQQSTNMHEYPFFVFDMYILELAKPHGQYEEVRFAAFLFMRQA